jgi:hypothetical protein
MNDRELLELAAKAAGLEYHWVKVDGGSLMQASEPGSRSEESWNPLIDDGDALRLAVKLNLIIGCYGTYTAVCETYDKPVHSADSRGFVCWKHETGGDASAATRHAIVRAAAQIGATQPSKDGGGGE